MKSPCKKQQSRKAVHEIDDRQFRYLNNKLENMKDDINRKLNVILSKLESVHEEQNTKNPSSPQNDVSYEDLLRECRVMLKGTDIDEIFRSGTTTELMNIHQKGKTQRNAFLVWSRRVRDAYITSGTKLSLDQRRIYLKNISRAMMEIIQEDYEFDVHKRIHNVTYKFVYGTLSDQVRNYYSKKIVRGKVEIFLIISVLKIIHVIASGGKTSPTTNKNDGEDEDDAEDNNDKKNEDEDDMIDEDEDDEAEDEDNEDEEDADEKEVRRSDRACKKQDAARKKATTARRLCERSPRRTSPRKQR